MPGMNISASSQKSNKQMPDNTFDVKGGNNQILPTAQQAIQYNYYGDSAIKLAHQQSGKTVDDQSEDTTSSGNPSPGEAENEQTQHEVPNQETEIPMKTGILHLSDLHINRDNSQWLIKKAEQIVPAVWNAFSECGKIIIVVTGDITAAGTEEQYGYAKEFFRVLKRTFAKRGLAGRELENKIICVPGNHDCNYDQADNARKMLLGGMRQSRFSRCERLWYHLCRTERVPYLCPRDDDRQGFRTLHQQ